MYRDLSLMCFGRKPPENLEPYPSHFEHTWPTDGRTWIDSYYYHFGKNSSSAKLPFSFFLVAIRYVSIAPSVPGRHQLPLLPLLRLPGAVCYGRRRLWRSIQVCEESHWWNGGCQDDEEKRLPTSGREGGVQHVNPEGLRSGHFQLCEVQLCFWGPRVWLSRVRTAGPESDGFCDGETRPLFVFEGDTTNLASGNFHTSAYIYMRWT